MIEALKPENWIAVYAAIVATGALFLEVRRWAESGPKMSLTAIPEAKTFGGGASRDETFIALTATSRGFSPTTITHFVLQTYPTAWSRLRGRPKETFVITDPMVLPIPYRIGPGEQWMGMVPHDTKVREMLSQGGLYARVIISHRSKPFRIRIKSSPTVSA